MRVALPCLVMLALVTMPIPAGAGSSPWFRTDGARLRLLTIDEPTADGTLRGALEIDLDAGWKTYWADPGDAGIPPQVDVAGSTNLASAELFFPAPRRFDDGYAQWAGYAQPVVLPVTFKVDDPTRFSAIDVDVLLGICHEICVPVQARLSVNAGSAADDEAARAAVELAFATLPVPANDEFGVVSAIDRGKTLDLEVRLPEGTREADVFVVAPSGLKLGKPSASGSGSERTFSIPVEQRSGSSPPAFGYTLVAGERAVSGTARLD